MTKKITKITATKTTEAGPREMKSLVAAFTRVADFLEEEGVRNRRTGEIGNILGFSQRQVLAQFIRAMDNAIQYELHGPRPGSAAKNYSLDVALANVVRNKAAYVAGDEVSERNLAAATAWVKDIEYRLMHLAMISDALHIVYKKKVGETYGTPRRAPEVPLTTPEHARTKTTDEADAMLARYRKPTHAAPAAQTGAMSTSELPPF